MNWDARAHEHEVVVTVSAGARPIVTCHYICAVGSFDLWIPEHKLQSDVEELEKLFAREYGATQTERCFAAAACPTAIDIHAQGTILAARFNGTVSKKFRRRGS